MDTLDILEETKNHGNEAIRTIYINQPSSKELKSRYTMPTTGIAIL
jgi:hypothetical protein